MTRQHVTSGTGPHSATSQGAVAPRWEEKHPRNDDPCPRDVERCDSIGPSTLGPEPRGPNLNGASIVDEHGREIPITEAMIENALQQLDGAWEAKRAECEAVQRARTSEAWETTA